MKLRNRKAKIVATLGPACETEKAIEELEDIIKNLEQGDVPLDITIELYERGAKLKDFCEKKLKDAEIKIKKINENTKTKEISIED